MSSSNYLHSRNILSKGTLRQSVGSGSRIRFWKDVWLGDMPLCARFNRLYRLELDENCMLNERFISGNWSWQWRRPITSGRTADLLHILMLELSHIELSSNSDSWTWSIGEDGLFSVAATRLHIDHSTLPSSSIGTRWNKGLPRKVNIFIWRLRLDRLPTRLNLSKRGLEIDSIMCPICNANVESNDHVFFNCEVASSVWCLIRSWCNLSCPLPSSSRDWLTWIDNLPGSSLKKDRLYVIIASMFWTIWKYRNSITFSSNSMRKCDIFDSIRLISFSWLKYRGRKISSWIDWLCNPL